MKKERKENWEGYRKEMGKKRRLNKTGKLEEQKNLIGREREGRNMKRRDIR